jgi:hypothetical protein
VQFVQDQEPQPLRGPDQMLALVRAGQHQLEHHVVGQQDVRRLGQDPSPLVVPLLPGVPGERHRLPALRIPEPQKLLQLTQLGIGQRVHRIDDDRLHPGTPPAAVRGSVAQHAVHDRDDVGQRLARPSPRGQHIRLAGTGDLDRLALVTVQRQRRRPGIVAVGLHPEDPLTLRIQQTLANELGHRSAAGEARVQAQPRVRPLRPLGQLPVHVLTDPVVTDLHEAGGERPIVSDQLLMDLEHVHAADQPPRNDPSCSSPDKGS